MPLPARSARRRPDGSHLRLTGTAPRFGSFAASGVRAVPAVPAVVPGQAAVIRLGVPTGAGTAAAPRAIGGARVPAAGARTVLPARRRRT